MLDTLLELAYLPVQRLDDIVEAAGVWLMNRLRPHALNIGYCSGARPGFDISGRWSWSSVCGLCSRFRRLAVRYRVTSSSTSATRCTCDAANSG